VWLFRFHRSLWIVLLISCCRQVHILISVDRMIIIEIIQIAFAMICCLISVKTCMHPLRCS
jgi:dolichyl-phosphate-mannose--protein O-mannosyl transferase